LKGVQLKVDFYQQGVVFQVGLEVGVVLHRDIFGAWNVEEIGGFQELLTGQSHATVGRGVDRDNDVGGESAIC
jgi:hypothetical protein